MRDKVIVVVVDNVQLKVFGFVMIGIDFIVLFG